MAADAAADLGRLRQKNEVCHRDLASSRQSSMRMVPPYPVAAQVYGCHLKSFP